MIGRVMLFGATGDLAGRFLLPALARLQAAGNRPLGARVVDAAGAEHDDVEFQPFATQRIGEHAGDARTGSREALAPSLRDGKDDCNDPVASRTVYRLICGAAPWAQRR
jgi:glucose-6-phosphate 1-dehydrogenase